jgi:hypothetical protein
MELRTGVAGRSRVSEIHRQVAETPVRHWIGCAPGQGDHIPILGAGEVLERRLPDNAGCAYDEHRFQDVVRRVSLQHAMD